MIENQKKKKIWTSKKFYINLHLKDSLQMTFTACSSLLMPESALTLFTLYVMHIVSLQVRHSY